VKKIAVVGSLAFDYIFDFPQTFEENILPDKIKNLSVSFLAEKLCKNFGGVAGNITYNLSLLNCSSSIISCAGKADFSLYREHLKKMNVDISFVEEVENEFCANAFIVSDRNNCQISAFYPGALLRDNDLIKSLGEKMKMFDLIVVGPTVPEAMNSAVKLAKKYNIAYLYDPAQQIPSVSRDDLRYALDGAEIIIGNDYELSLINNKSGYSNNDLIAKSRILITTLGEKGSLVESDNDKHNIGVAEPLRLVDTTGAGDAYIAGFVAGYVKNLDVKSCAKIGATLSSFVIEEYGTQNHKISLSNFGNRYKTAFGEAWNFELFECK